MKLGVCSDHAGYQLKEQIEKQLATMRIECVGYGTHSKERCDYLDYVHQLAFAMQMGTADRGIVICGTGNGTTMALDKYSVTRVGLAWNEDAAKLIRAHSDADVLVMSTRFIETAETERCLYAFLDTPFRGGRHKERIGKMVLPTCQCLLKLSYGGSKGPFSVYSGRTDRASVRSLVGAAEGS